MFGVGVQYKKLYFLICLDCVVFKQEQKILQKTKNLGLKVIAFSEESKFFIFLKTSLLLV